MLDVRLGYEPFPGTGQSEFWRACGFELDDAGFWARSHDAPRSPFPALVGPARIGKTKTGTAVTILNAIEFPARYMVLAPTYSNHMLMTTLPEYIDQLEGLHKQFMSVVKKPLVKLTADGNTYHKTERTIELENGSKLFFRSTEEVSSLYGPTIGGFHLDEAGLMPEDAVTVMQMRMTDTGGAQQGIFTFTPKGSVKHWTARMFGPQLKAARDALDRDELGVGPHDMYPVFSLRIDQNPRLTKWLVAEMKRRAEFSPLAHQEFYGEWSEVGGLIFPMFNEGHIRPPGQRSYVTYRGGIDFGLSAPTSIHVVAEDMNGRWWVCREYYQPFSTLEQEVGACRRYMEEFPGITFVGDPRSPERLANLRANYIPIKGAKADHGSVDARVSLLWQRLTPREDGEPGIYIAPECVNLIAEMESWSWKPTAQKGGVVRYDDVEPHFHACDSLGYAVLALNRAWHPTRVISAPKREKVYA